MKNVAYLDLRKAFCEGCLFYNFLINELTKRTVRWTENWLKQGDRYLESVAQSLAGNKSLDANSRVLCWR